MKLNKSIQGILRFPVWIGWLVALTMTQSTFVQPASAQDDASDQMFEFSFDEGSHSRESSAAECPTCVDSKQPGAGYYFQNSPQPTSTPELSKIISSRVELPPKCFCGADEQSVHESGKPGWRSSKRLIPWESYAYGEYIGPSRTPHIPQYRLRVDDQLEFVFQADRQRPLDEYRLTAGDTIRVVSAVDETLNEATIVDGTAVLGDGTVSLELIGNVVAAGKTIQELQAELEKRYRRFFDSPPRINVSGILTDTARRDFLESVDARAGAGGIRRFANVIADGTLRLPLIGAINAVDLTLDELEVEVNARLEHQIQGIRVSVVLAQRAPRFFYVLGEVEQPGRIELNGPTSLMQSIALAGGWRNGGNIRQIVVFRRDKNWRLMALKLNLRGGLLGKHPTPSDDIWLRDSDIVLIPKSPILRLADAIDLYFTRSIYGIFPSELGSFDAQSLNAF